MDYKLQNILDKIYIKTKCLDCGKVTRSGWSCQEHVNEYHRCQYCNSFNYEEC